MRADVPRSRAETSGFTETSTFDDVVRFLGALRERAPSLHLETFGSSVEGRPLPLAVVSDPPVRSPEEARASGRPVAFVLANIHAGEVEGKEAAQHLLRRLLLGDLAPLARRLVVLVAPIYNAEGNERFGPVATNRPGQDGPPSVGVRANAMGLDLNRDHMKLETPEARALVAGVYRRWDPHLTVDCHATDGSYHGYAVTWAPPLTPNGRAEPKEYVRSRLLPAVAARLREGGVRTFPYGNFDDPKDPSSGWRTFDHRPRFGNSYLGLCNRLCVLSEAYVYDDFRRRVEATEAFAAALLQRLGEDGEAAMAACRVEPRGDVGVRFAFAPPEPREVIARETPLGPDRPVVVPVTDAFVAVRSVPRPAGWWLEPALRRVAELCRLHGIVVEEAPARRRAHVESYRLLTWTREEQPFQGHQTVLLETERVPRTVELPAGSCWVPAAQPLGDLAATLLEPESDDGVAQWNLLDEHLVAGALLPVHRGAGAQSPERT
jgi:hypothetical protein